MFAPLTLGSECRLCPSCVTNARFTWNGSLPAKPPAVKPEQVWVCDNCGHEVLRDGAPAPVMES